MRREALYPFLPAALAALTDVVTAAIVHARQPDYPGRFIVFQIVMFGAALLAAVPNKWVRIVGLVLLLAGSAHFNGGGASLSSDVLCFRVGDDER